MPDAAQMRVFQRERKRIPKTKDWLADDAVTCKPISAGKFPVKQGKNRVFHRFIDLRRRAQVKKANIYGYLSSDSLMKLTGNHFGGSGD